MNLDSILESANLPLELKEEIRKQSVKNEHLLRMLKEKEGQLRVWKDGIETSFVGIILTDIDDNILNMNKAALKMTGYEKEEQVLGRHLLDFWVREEIHDTTNELGESGRRRGEEFGKRKDGSLFPIQFSAQTIKDETGKPRYIFYSFIDKTESMLTEDLISKNEGLYQSFVQNFQGIAFRGTMDFTPIFFHGNVEEITGYTEEDFTSGKLKWDEVIYPDDFEVIHNTSKDLLTVPKYSVGREYRIIKKNGQIVWIYERIQSMTDSTGKIKWLQGVIFDNTHRKDVEAALRKSEEQYRMLVEKMEEGVLLEDSEGRIKFVNPRTERMLDYDKNDLIGKHWTAIIPIEELENTQMESLQRSKGIGSVYESVLSTKTGRLIPVIVTATPIFSSDEEFEGVLTVFTDISDRKKLELQKEEFNKRQKEFIDQTTHELKTPLTIIRGYTEILLKQENDENRIMIFESMLRNCKRLEELSEGVSDIYKLERGMFEVFLNKVDFREFLLPSLEPYIQLYSGQIHFESVDKKPMLIKGDTSRLLTVVNNILDNAIKNTSKTARTIKISLKRESDQLQLIFTDNGAGIDPIHIDKIFDKFVSFPTSLDVRGTGIGLYLSLEIIKAHNGTIKASSEGIGKGTTISIKIPLLK